MAEVVVVRYDELPIEVAFALLDIGANVLIYPSNLDSRYLVLQGDWESKEIVEMLKGRVSDSVYSNLKLSVSSGGEHA
jgi:hypothetical protein